MVSFADYFAQCNSNNDASHYDVHTDRWVDEAKESIYGHSGHADVHTDEK